jgi:hypothetical protein
LHWKGCVRFTEKDEHRTPNTKVEFGFAIRFYYNLRSEATSLFDIRRWMFTFQNKVVLRLAPAQAKGTAIAASSFL